MSRFKFYYSFITRTISIILPSSRSYFFIPRYIYFSISLFILLTYFLQFHINIINLQLETTLTLIHVVLSKLLFFIFIIIHENYLFILKIFLFLFFYNSSICRDRCHFQHNIYFLSFVLGSVAHTADMLDPSMNGIDPQDSKCR